MGPRGEGPSRSPPPSFSGHANRLASSLLNKDPNHFWMLIKRDIGGSTSLPMSLGGVSGHENISAMWKTYFEAIYNDDSCVSDRNILRELAHMPATDMPPITTADVCAAVS